MSAVSRDRSAESATVLSSAAGEKSAEAIVEQVEAPMLTVHSAEAEVSAGVTYVESSAESATVSSSAAGEKSVEAIGGRSVEQVEAPVLTVHSAEAEVSPDVTYVESSAESATVSSSAAGEKSVRKFHSSFVLPNPSNLSPDLAEFMFKDLVDSLLLSSFEDAG